MRRSDGTNLLKSEGTKIAIAVTLLVLLGVGLRLATVPTSFAWLDEANSILGASRSPGDIIVWLRTQENGPPLFIYLLHYWIQLFGDRDVVCSLMPLAFSVLTPICLYFLSRELFGTRAAVWAVFLSSVNVRSIKMASYIRFYSLLELLTTLSYLLFFRMMNRKKHFWLYSLICVIGIYEHYYFAFVIFSQLAICLAFYRKRFPLLLGTTCIVAAMFSPWLPIAIEQFGSGANSWLRVVTGPEQYSAWLYSAIFIHSGIFQLFSPVLRLTFYTFVGAFLVAWAVRIIVCRERVPRDQESIRIYSIVAAYLLCVGLPIFISMAKPIYEPGRYDIIGLPLLILFFSWAFSKIKNRWSILLLILFYLAQTFSYQLKCRRPTPPAPCGSYLPPFNDKVIARKLSRIISPDDVIIYSGLSRLSTEYYLGQYGVRVKRTFMFPKQLENHPGWLDLDGLLADTGSLEGEARSIADSVLETGAPRIYLFDGYHDRAISNYLVNEMDRRFTRDRTYDWNGSFYNMIRVYTTGPPGNR